MQRSYSLGLVALLLHLACPQSTRAQIVGKSVPAFTTAAGTLIRPGDTLRLGRGTLPNGDFQYVFVPDNVFTGSKQQNFTSQLSNLALVKSLVQMLHGLRGGIRFPLHGQQRP